MKKFTKRLTMIVAVLLSLVLLSSSIVSTTLAKYVVTKDVTANLQLQKFGLTVDLKVDEKLNPETKDIGNSAVVTIENFMLKPGDNFSNAITASISGKPNVDANVTIDVTVSCDDNNFKVLKDDFDGISAITKDTIYTPVGFFVGGTNVIASYKTYTVSTTKTTVLAEAIEAALTTKIATNAGNGLTRNTTTNVITGTLDAETITEPISMTNLGIGFAWDDSNTSSTNAYQEIGTYISDKYTPTFTITYKITVEQAS